MAGRPSGYSGLQIGLHWTVACLVIFQFLAHDPIEHAWRAYAGGTPADPDARGMVVLHVIAGGLILVLAAWRLWLRFTRGVPALPDNEPAVFRVLARATHILIYALIIGMPISGAVAWFGGVPEAAAAHVLARTVLLVLVILHVAGALFQQVFLRSNVLSRMLMSED